MKLSVEIKPDFHNNIAIVDYTREFDEYLPEDINVVLPRYYNFKYSETCTINILKYVNSKKEEIIETHYDNHSTETDSSRLRLPQDGYYIVYHLVLPTLDWLESVKNENLSEYNNIYVTDGNNIYKYFQRTLQIIDSKEVTEVNPYKTTISIVTFQIFSIDRLKHCYVNASKNVLQTYIGKCETIDNTTRFNRDFLWMTINVIGCYLEWNEYEKAQLTLEGLSCYNFCDLADDGPKYQKSCGCRK